LGFLILCVLALIPPTVPPPPPPPPPPALPVPPPWFSLGLSPAASKVSFPKLLLFGFGLFGLFPTGLFPRLNDPVLELLLVFIKLFISSDKSITLWYI